LDTPEFFNTIGGGQIVKASRVIIITAMVWFFLSFIIALFSRAGIGLALLRALLSAAVCATVCAGLLFAAKKFLLEGTEIPGKDVSVADAEDDELETPPAGSRVNIMLDDEALPAEPGDPGFDVRGIAGLIGKPPVRAAESAPQNALRDEGVFERAPQGAQTKNIPITDVQAAVKRLAQIDSESPRKKQPESAEQSGSNTQARQGNFVAASPAEITAPRAENAAPEKSAGGSFGSGVIVDLPDIGDLVTEGLSNEDEVINDTDFAAATKEEVATGRKVRVEDVDVSDSKAIAGAIRTLLVNG
jgi:hypothetical protein